jgi:(4-(4-[2-(gamma-L-glutamylamino)ethyl]phenoxymethyl)furan-2-yl)methanamine synthase
LFGQKLRRIKRLFMFDSNNFKTSYTHVTGWDIGGANVKAVSLNVAGEVLQTLQLPCPLWRGLDHLEKTVMAILVAFKVLPKNVINVITMTGELVDLFPNRHAGVLEIAATLNRLLRSDTENIVFYAANHGFVYFNQVSALSKHIASANWHASASAIAQNTQNAILIDIGSTTTDIIPIQSSKVQTDSVSDAERMQTDHLVYTGVVRTPMMALGNKLLFNGVETNVAAEYFATMADVYRLTGELLQDADMDDTADGQGKSVLESARRLARMVGHDVEDKPLEAWKSLAFVCRSMQVDQIKLAVLKHLKPNMPIIGAGAGSFLVKSLADELGHTYLSISQVFEKGFDDFHDLAVCFPAYAVAHLYLSLNQFQAKQKFHA